MSKKILITGAAGFVGSHLVDFLLEKRVPLSKLRLFVWNDESLDNLPDKKFDIVRGDIRNKKDVRRAMKDVEVVYHLAARIDFEGKTYKEYHEVNVRGTKNLLDEAVKNKKKHGFKKFINYSSIGVYGLPAGVGDIINWDETHPPTYSNFYGKSKWEAEEVVRRYYKNHNISYATIRPASVYGPREKGPTLALYKAIRAGRFLKIGSGKNKMHYVYVRDLVEATYLAGKSKIKNGEYIIAGARPTKFEDVIKHISKSINRLTPELIVPKEVAMLVAYFFEFVHRATGIKFPLFPSRVRTMTTSYYYNISKARRELGYKPKVSFAKGAKLSGKWYLENGYL